MIDAFHSKEDIHSHTAEEIFGVDIKRVTKDQRRVAKTVNFGVLYGMSPYGLSQALGIDQSQAVEYIKKYFEKHVGIKEYCNHMIETAEREGYVETLFGFKRQLLNIHSPYRNVAEAEERMAINTPVQGTAAEILKLAMIELASNIQHSKLNKSVRMLLTIHDEIVLEAPEKDAKKVAKLVKDVMENVVKICVPIEAEVETGKNLGELKAMQ
jgi:DNA polymerase-1